MVNDTESLAAFLRMMLAENEEDRRFLEFERARGAKPGQLLGYILDTCPPDCEDIKRYIELHRDDAERIIAGFLGYA